MNQPSGKTSESKILFVHDDRWARRACAYCGIMFRIFHVPDFYDNDVCTNCSWVLDRRGVIPAVSRTRAGRRCSQEYPG